MTLSLLFWILFGLYAVVVVLWLIGLVLVRRLRLDDIVRLTLAADATRAGAPAATARLAVYVAAHNEERRIESCLGRLLEQDYPQMTVTVINDRSTDRTAELVRQVAAKDARVRLVEVSELPPGWVGKTHALAVATRQIDADYLLFVDGDCRLAPGAVRTLMGKVAAEGIDFLTLWPRLELVSPSEQWLTPPAIWLLAAWTILASLRRGGRDNVQMGNGQFLLMSRSGYERIGGHEGVAAELAEDAILAAKAAEAGLKCQACSGDGVYVTSRDNKPATTFNALTRVLIGSLVEPWKMLVSQQLLLGGCAVPVWMLPLATTIGVITGEPAAWACAAAAVVHWVFMSIALRPMFDLVFAKRGGIWHFPIGALVCAGVTVRAYLVMTGRGTVRWGTSRYRVRGSRIQGAATVG